MGDVCHGGAAFLIHDGVASLGRAVKHSYFLAVYRVRDPTADSRTIGLTKKNQHFDFLIAALKIRGQA